jgi:undecaprenyl-diphosphatase
MADHEVELDDGWTSGVASGLALAGFLTLVLVAFTLLAMGPLVLYDAYFSASAPPGQLQPFLHILDRLGQRAVALPILALVVVLIHRRAGTWRPAVTAAAGVFALNVVVLVLKVALGRSFPHTGDPSFFTGGMAYPSGHSANVVLVYGLAVYLWTRYTDPPRRTRVLMWGTVGALSVTMVATSIALNWHWFADLVAGLLVGAIVLEVTASLDRHFATPRPPAVGAADHRPARS